MEQTHYALKHRYYKVCLVTIKLYLSRRALNYRQKKISTIASMLVTHPLPLSHDGCEPADYHGDWYADRHPNLFWPSMQPYICIIRTHHDWPSQMHENLLISRVKTRAIANVMTPLINILMGVYYIMIIIKISKKRILIGRIFHYRRCHSGGTRWNHLIVLGLAVALADAFPPMIMEFPRAIQMTSRAALRTLGSPKQQVGENRCELVQKTERMSAF